jgi:cytoskeleton protein RodZ
VSSETGSPSSSRRLNLKDVKEAPSASAESVGMELRAMRLHRGDTIAQVSQVLRIRKEMVEAIEHGRHDLLPGHAYEIGFVRSYADYLRLDTADVVRRFKAELAAQAATGQFNLQVPEEEQRFSFVSVGIILLCLVAAGAGAWYLADRQGWLGASRPLGPTVAASDPPASTTPQPETIEPSPPAAGPAVAAPLPAAPVAVPPPPAAPLPGGIVAPAPGEQPTAITGKELGKSNTDARIVFIARREGFLTIAGSDSRQPYINRILTAGDAYRVPNKRGLVMQLSDAGALDVMLDGKFIGRAGADGLALKDFELSPEVYGAAAGPPRREPAAVEPALPQAAPAPTPPASPAGGTAP